MPRGIYERTKETKEKMKQYALNRTQEHKQKLKKSGKGRKFSLKAKINMSKARIKAWKEEKMCRVHTKESNEKLSKSLKGSIKKNGHCWTGKHHTEETKLKMSKTAENRRNFISSWEERFILTCLSKCFPSRFLKQQYRLKGLSHAFDVALPEFKILIEIDGKYFHSLPEHLNRDAGINEFVYRNYPDWTLFRFDDNNLKQFGLIK